MHRSANPSPRAGHHRPRTRRIFRAFAAGFGLALIAAACGGSDSSDSASGGDCTVGSTDGDLAFYTWAEYIDPELVEKFQTETGVAVTVDTYDSNEAMQPIISAGNSGYDVIVPSDYMVSILIDAGDITKLNKDVIPNLKNLRDDFASDLPYDPAGDYVAPYQWGTTGLGVDLGVTGEDIPATWGLVFDPALSAQYGLDGKISLLNDPRETMGAALKYLGHSLNSTSQSELDEAKALISETRSRLAAFDTDGADENLVSGETAIAHGYSGDFIVQFDESENPDQYTYFVPDEGGTRWVDNMAVVKDAPHPCTAHTFINFILDGANGAQLSEWNYYGSPNAEAEKLMDPEVLNDPTVYPPDQSKLEFISDTGDFETNFSDAFIEAKG